MPIAEPLDQLARAAGIKGGKLVGKQGIGGSTVTQHWGKEDNRAKEAIRTGGVDVLTVAPNRLLPDPAIGKFADLLLEHNPAGRVTVQASWAPLDGTGGKEFKNEERDRADPAALGLGLTAWPAGRAVGVHR